MQVKQLEKEVYEAEREAAQLKRNPEEDKDEITKLTLHKVIVEAREEIAIS